MFSMKGKLYAWLAAFGAFVLGVLTVYNKGRKDAETEEILEETNEYIETRKRVDQAVGSRGNPDVADARERLRQRAERKQR